MEWGKPSLRIISGIKRGKNLLTFEGEHIRPTTDRVKEAIFNLIQDRVYDSVVYDAFSGTGALAIEAVSRGAQFAVCTDVDDRSIDIIHKNFEGCSFSDKCEIIKTSACSYLEKTDKQFDLIFMDPPYNKGLVTPALELIIRRNILSPNGSIIIERDGVDDTFDHSGFSVEKERSYGRTVITVLKSQQKEV